MKNSHLKHQQKQFDYISTNIKLFHRDSVKTLCSLAKHQDEMKEKLLTYQVFLPRAGIGIQIRTVRDSRSNHSLI